jgi:ferredoxin
LICEVAIRGDSVAQDLIISTGRYLGIALSTVVQVLNPELIVVGGGLTKMGSMLLDPCLESLRQNVHPVLWGAGRIVLSRFQQNVSIIGGAAVVFSEMESDVRETVSEFAPVALDRTAPARSAIRLSNAERSALEHVEGNVFDVQRYSLDDGPGLRTAVFLKGCPLRCAWCANPESQRVIPELLLFPNSCIACGACVDICSAESRKLDGDHIDWDRTSCTRCGDCAQICPAQATVWSGVRRAAGDLLREALSDSASQHHHRNHGQRAMGDPRDRQTLRRSLAFRSETYGQSGAPEMDRPRKRTDLVQPPAAGCIGRTHPGAHAPDPGSERERRQPAPDGRIPRPTRRRGPIPRPAAVPQTGPGKV